ncbi:MAG: GerMN domain-containing protein [Acidobacteria bacterium]|nr:GerMN domain-containing protein [Acidobacteriota bacterium]
MRSLFVLALAGVVFTTACTRRQETDAPSAAMVAVEAANKVAPRPVVLYFGGPSGLLVPETRTLPLPESNAAAAALIAAAVIEGSANSAVPRLFPPDATVRAAWLLPEGTAVVDLGGETLETGWDTGSTLEMSAAYSLVQSLAANLPEVKRVRILIGGEQAATLGGHLDLGRSLQPRSSMVEGIGGNGEPAAPPAAGGTE